MKISNRFSNILLTFVGIVFALLLGEVLVRNFFVAEKFISDPELGWKGNPRFGHDANGFRNASVPEISDIVAIGDSQTYGENAGMEESWPYRLGAYQMAFGGYGPSKYAMLVDRALELQPSTLIIGFFSGNDLRDVVEDVYSDDRFIQYRDPSFTPHWQRDTSMSPDANLILQYGTEERSAKLFFVKIKNWLYGHSKLYVFVGKASRVLRERLGVTQTLAERDEAAFVFAREHPESGIAFELGDRSTILAPRLRNKDLDLADENIREGFRITQQLFTDIRDRTAGKTKLIFVYIPTKEYVYAHRGTQPDLKEYYQIEKSLQDAFFKFCDKIQTVCIDATPGLVKALETTPIVPLGADGHYNANGYAVIAQSIRHELKK